MRAEDVKRFTAAMVGLYNTFDRQPNTSVNDAYFDALADLTIENVERAAKLAIGKCRFFPRPVELREMIEGTPEDAASTAWDRLQQAYRKAGYWTSVLFEDGATAEAMNRVFGGWQQFCEAMHPVFIAEDRASIADREQMLAERRNPDDSARQIQVGGLSPEMMRARQKDFLTAYRQAVREGFNRQPQYVRGYCESQNLQGQIGRGVPTEIGGQKILALRVYIQGATGRMVEAEFDFYTGQLLTPLPALLERPVLRVLPPKQELKLLAGQTEEMIEPEKVRQFLKDAVADLADAMRMPALRTGLSEEEIAARREELKRQLADLEAKEKRAAASKAAD